MTANSLRLSLRQSLLWIILPGVALPLGFALLASWLFPQGYWPSVPFHSLLEGAGVILNLSIAIYLFLLLRAKQLPLHFMWIAAGFLAMAILGGFHGAVEPGNSFVGLHSTGVLVGGLLFAMIALPKKFHHQAWLPLIPYLTVLAVTLLSLVILFSNDLFPQMLRAGAFSDTAILFNSIGALGFVIATVRFILCNDVHFAPTILAIYSLLFAVAGILFEYSILWDATWWLWHIIRFLALSVVLSYFFYLFYQQTETTRIHAQKLETLAFRDSLTQLPNRSLFYQQLTQTLSQARRDKTRIALMFIDLDRFKIVNDTLGHDVGDHLLVEVAARLQKSLRQADLLARMGGDEFTVILHGDQNQHTAGLVAQHLIDALKPPYHIHGHHIEIGASIGIAFYPSDSPDVNSLMRLADTAMYAAKNSGRNSYCFYAKPQNEAEQNPPR